MTKRPSTFAYRISFESTSSLGLPDWRRGQQKAPQDISMATAATARPTASSMPNKSSAPTANKVTILLTTFAGLGLPRTLSLPVQASTSVHDALDIIYSRLPRIDHKLIVTTNANKQLLLSDTAPISSHLAKPQDAFLPLRLSARLCGGKGGFGSQLRAAGGRMSSRKNRNQNQNPNGSNRNLDGRRLRTVDEAKKLAEYLAIKPEMEQKEKEERRKRWEAVVETAERREEEIKSGKMGSGQGRLDAEYVESKEAAEERTREAVLKAMREGMLATERTGSESSMDEGEEGSEDEAEGGSSGSSEDAKAAKKEVGGRAFFGWDEDDEDSSEDEAAHDATPAYEGKGKAKAS